MLFKMLFMERSYLLDQEKSKEKPFTRHPRQVFVTKSRVLATKVKELYDVYYTSLGKASTASVTSAKRISAEPDEYDFLRNDQDIRDLDSDVPSKLSELEDMHFPLFITVDRVSYDRISFLILQTVIFNSSTR